MLTLINMSDIINESQEHIAFKWEKNLKKVLTKKKTSDKLNESLGCDKKQRKLWKKNGLWKLNRI